MKNMAPQAQSKGPAHWQDINTNDRLAHLIRHAARSQVRGLQMRLAAQNVLFGHWALLRILWEEDGLTKQELHKQEGLKAPTTYSELRDRVSAGYIALKPSTDRK